MDSLVPRSILFHYLGWGDLHERSARVQSDPITVIGRFPSRGNSRGLSCFTLELDPLFRIQHHTAFRGLSKLHRAPPHRRWSSRSRIRGKRAGEGRLVSDQRVVGGDEVTFSDAVGIQSCVIRDQHVLDLVSGTPPAVQKRRTLMMATQLVDERGSCQCAYYPDRFQLGCNSMGAVLVGGSRPVKRAGM